MATKALDAQPGAATERRISWLTLTIGIAAGIAAALLRGRVFGVGIGIGAALAWLNFRWLKRGLDALVVASTGQADREKVQVPLGSYFAAMFRYALLGLAVYVNFKYLKVPVSSMLVGLCALGAAAITASLYEVLHPAE